LTRRRQGCCGANAACELPDGRVECLNDKQAEAVASALSRDTTFICGPPGTGKTRTIGKSASSSSAPAVRC
jgi:phosphate starvation-inducible protein PhoH